MSVLEPESWSLGRLLSTAARQIEHEWNDRLADHGLTHAGLMALHALDTGPLTQRQLAAASRVEEQTMSRVVARLVRTGHVTRGRDERDRRRLVIRRTPLGDRVFTELQNSKISDALVAGPLADPETFRRELLRLVTAPRAGGKTGR